MWLKNLFARASEIDRLQREVDFTRRQKEEIEGLLEREESRNALLESALKTEQKAHNMALRRYADQMSKQVGLNQHFVADATPKEADKPLQLSPDEEERVTWMAKVQRDEDVDAGLSPRPIEFYENIIREDPSKYLIS
jgi:hypothetical protein